MTRRGQPPASYPKFLREKAPAQPPTTRRGEGPGVTAHDPPGAGPGVGGKGTEEEEAGDCAGPCGPGIAHD
jgi:hypothetical protein